MNDTPLQLALREVQASFTSPRALLGMAAVALVLGLSGPFDTFVQMGAAQRLVYWLAVVLLTYAIGRFTATLVGEVMRERLPQRPARLLVAAIVCGMPVTATVLAINAIAFNGSPGIEPLLLWLYCTLIATAVLFVVSTLVAGPVAAPVPADPDAPPALLERLPHPQRGRLLALSVQDHYVEVLTDKGRALVLMRLSDAIRETGAVPGLQIHRSHWVALAAVKRVVRAGGKVLVELPNGDRLPISRGFLPAARAAGLVV